MSGYIGNIPVPQATQTRDVFTATASQTSFATAGYPVGFVDVWLNGVKLINGTDFTATNGSDVVLTVGAAAGDTVEVISNSTFEVNSQNFTGGLTVNNDAATVLTVDRATSDGTLVDFKKDGTSVGGIGVISGDAYIATGDVGLRFDDGNNILRPVSSTGADQDATINIGGPSQRFKSAYLSGGVYLGGTGSANYLDDYEEGTWTPASSGNCTINSIINTQYVKVGNLVSAWAYINVTTTSQGFTLNGLPFTASGSAYGPANIYYPTSHAFKGYSYVEPSQSFANYLAGSTMSGVNIMLSATYHAS